MTDRKPPASETRTSDGAPCPLGSGDVLAGRYAVELCVGEGTFGWVFAALDVGASPPRRVALKVLRPRYAARGDAVRRFERRELALLLRVQALSPTAHVVRALEPAVLWHGNLPCLVLEFIDGPSLRELLDGGPLAPGRARGIGAGLARGLAALHAAGGVHRDLKPSNVRLRGGAEPVIVDLGITRALWETQEATEPGPGPMTPRYASPEQRTGQEAGPASDVYSLGLILFELLTGDVPPRGQELQAAHAARAGRERELWAWVKRCLEPDPRRRPEALEVASALSAAEPDPGRPRALRWAAGAGAVLLLALGGVVASRSPKALPPPGPPPAPWSRRFGDAERQKHLALAVDDRGFLSIAGSFRGSMDLGTGPLTSAGSEDIFVARLDPEGRALWSRRFGGDAWQGANSIASDSAGNVFIAGGFLGTLDFGGSPFFNPANMDAFLARLDSEGRPLWSRRFGDEGEQGATNVVASPEGHAILTGPFHGTIDLGGGPLRSAGLSDVFLARFDPDGRLLWGKRFGDARRQHPNSLAVSGEGDILLSGVFEGSIDLGGGVLTSMGGMDHFVALFDASGRPRWSRRLGDSGEQRGCLATFDDTGRIVLAEVLTPTAGDTVGLRVTGFAPDGSTLWSKRLRSEEALFLAGIAAAPGGSVVLTGAIRGHADLGDGPFSGPGGEDVFVLELGPDGTVRDARRFGDGANQAGMAVGVDPGGGVLLGGTFEGTLDLGRGPLASAGEQDLFLARLTPPSVPPPPAEVGDCLPPPSGLAAWYPLDGSGSVPGRVGGALRLDGGFFEAPASAAHDFGQGPFSLSAWLRTSDIEGVRVLLDKRTEAPAGGPVLGYGLFLLGGRLGFQLADGGGPGKCSMEPYFSCTNYQSGRFVADGAWHLVTVTVDREDSSGGIFYVDGVEVGRFDPTLRGGSLDNDGPLRLGSRSSSETGLLRGLLDEVALWSRVLTPEEVASLYRAGSAGMCRPQSPDESSRNP